ncbi:hypothetical protein EKH55_3194 [Sinorhizobium alkalisoli]|nr:hypothetical protein EKH55_3194 [Sinorhizobium alkalisoli]
MKRYKSFTIRPFHHIFAPASPHRTKRLSAALFCGYSEKHNKDGTMGKRRA